MARVFVGNLDPRTQKQTLSDEASQYGKLTDVWVASKPPGFAFLTFEDERDAEDCVRSMHDSKIDGSHVKCELSKSHGGGQNGRCGLKPCGFGGGYGGYSSGGGGYGGDGGDYSGGSGCDGGSGYSGGAAGLMVPPDLDVLLTRAALQRELVARHGKVACRAERELAAHLNVRCAMAEPSGPYLLPGPMFAALQSGDVALISARWLIRRAFPDEELVRQAKCGVSSFQTSVEPLPSRQELEQREPDAFLSVDQLQELHAAFLDVVAKARSTYDARSATDDGVAAMPVVAVSHCWETEGAPDPSGTTLTKVAAGLARHMKVWARWGFEDMGVFIDWTSLYQNHPHPRSAEQQASFKRALKTMNIWYAHRLTTVFIVGDQPACALPRSRRGWPFFEEAVARLFKEEPRGTGYKRAGGTRIGSNWKRVVALDCTRHKRGPPLSSKRFEATLQEKTFTNGSDAKIVASLYRSTLRDGFGGVTQLCFPRVDWGNDELSALAETLMEVACPKLQLIKLSCSKITSLEALDRPIERGAIASVQTLVLAANYLLERLPSSIGKLSRLDTLVLVDCSALRSWPDSMAELANSLRNVDIRNCPLRRLPTGMEQVALRGGPIGEEELRHATPD